MKETTEKETELVSPPRVVATWSDNSPFMMSNPSPTGSIQEKSTPPLPISGADQVDRKRIADGFLSEVSTPDDCSKTQQDAFPPAENKNQVQPLDKLSPHKPLPAACSQLNIKDVGTTDGPAFPISNTKKEEELSSGRHSSEKSKFGSFLKEENKYMKSLKPEMTDAKEISCQVGEQQNIAATVKSKRMLACEEKVQRKRIKAGALEKSRGKGSGQWSHLSEDELKKLRRVKNRESVEKCRTKQRLRMEALQMEQTCLRLENKKLQEAMNSIHMAVHDVSMQVTKIKAHMQNHIEDGSGDNMTEMRKEVQA